MRSQNQQRQYAQMCSWKKKTAKLFIRINLFTSASSGSCTTQLVCQLTFLSMTVK